MTCYLIIRSLDSASTLARSSFSSCLFTALGTQREIRRVLGNVWASGTVIRNGWIVTDQGDSDRLRDFGLDHMVC